jgi:hypothetical protein
MTFGLVAFAFTSNDIIWICRSRDSDPNPFFDTNLSFEGECVGNSYCESLLPELGHPEWTINPDRR